MPLFPHNPASGSVPLLNSACPWASSLDDLRALYTSPHTSAITVRTSTVEGFKEDVSQHQMTFFGPGGQNSANCYGYSPFTLATYISWVRQLLKEDLPRKLVIFSVTGSIEETTVMLSMLQAFADELDITFGVEFNASCPNFRGHPPPAYVDSELMQYFTLLAAKASPNLKVGMKLPPYTYDAQFDVVLAALHALSPASGEHPIAFLTATNTLGMGLVFGEQIEPIPSCKEAQGLKSDVFALPGPYGGLAGAAVHQISLGNVHKFASLMKASPDVSLSSICLIGVGGACDAASVERFRRVGASAVACASALGREGVAAFAKLAGSSVLSLITPLFTYQSNNQTSQV